MKLQELHILTITTTGERMAVTNGVGGLDPRILVSSYGFKSIPGFHKDPVAARKRLIGAGVDFKIAEDALENTSDDCETYCVVTLVFEAT